MIPGSDLAFLRDLIRRSRWVFARTMPENPHWYTLRSETSDQEFVRFVQLIREHGRIEPREGRPYTVLDVDECFYWTMGAPISDTTLVNRKPLDRRAEPAAITFGSE